MVDRTEHVSALREQARALPYEQQIAPLQEAIRLADELGAGELGVQARQDLTSAYAMSGSPSHIFVPFSWVWQRYERGEAQFDEHMLFRLLWQYKWVICDLIDFPEVPLTQLQNSLDGMRRLYQRLGEGPHPVYHCAFELAWHVRGTRAALPEFDAWTAEARTRLSDCDACERNARARYYNELGRWQEALDEAVPVIAGEPTCNTEPARTLATVLEPLLHQGHADQAATAHLRGWRLTAGQRKLLFAAATQIEILARTGAIERGLDLVSGLLPHLDQAPSPWTEMRLAAAATRLLDTAAAEHGLGTMPVVTGVAPDATVDDVRDRLRQRAYRLARRFDERNQTPTVSQQIERVLTSPPLPALALVAPPSRRDTDVDRIESVRLPQAPTLPDLASASPAELNALVEQLQRYGVHADVERVADHWRTRAAAEEAVADPSPELLHDLGDLAYLLVWSRRQITIAEAAPLVTRSAALLRRAGDEAEALLVEQSQACRLGDLEQVRELLGRIDLVGDLTQRTRARLRMLQAGADEEELAELTRQIQALPVTADSPPLLRRFWAMGHFGPPDMERYEEHVAEALAVLQPGEYLDTQIRLRLNRVGYLAGVGRREERDAELDAVEALARSCGEPSSLAMVLHCRGRVRITDGDPATAEPYLLRAAALAEREQLPEFQVDALGQLADVLQQQGRLLEAAELAESALATLDLLQESGLLYERPLRSRYAMLCRLAGRLAGSLDEPTRALGLLKRALSLFEELDALAPAAETAADAGEIATTVDAVEAVRLYRKGIELAQRADHPTAWMVMSRAIARPLYDADGPDAAFRALDEAQRIHEDLEARALIDPDLRERCGQWRFDLAKLELRVQRARLLGSGQRWDEALAALGDAPEQFLAADQEVEGLNGQLLRARLLLAGDRIDRGLMVLEPLLTRLTEWGDQEATIQELAGMGARALLHAGREAEADAFWDKWSGSEPHGTDHRGG